ncbi:uncharacterized protein FTOL_13617 [Fusarium torulosum]|uniref:Uncharacterized protein n=1 Tax=Fusarium torulosum TaxID=33205 RepID=A0AAE8MMH2_9HYPO|nr:uncharacterized protein FTOL_13617 [Fusarium torulosum]
MGAKNLKLVYINADITQTIHNWHNQWDAAVDQTLLNPYATYIDIGRQYTPRIGSVAEANVFLWRRCCLKQLWRRRQGWSRRCNAMSPPGQQEPPKDSGLSRPGPVPLRLAEYTKLTLRDTVDMTIKPTDASREVREGLVYSQFYNLVKIPFDVAKQYPFQNRYLEKMALDPSYLADCERSTRGSRANQASLQLAYRLSKLRQTCRRDGQRQDLEAEQEGLGLCKTSKDYGLGWWLPGKFDWGNWRFKGEVSNRLMAGNNILRGEYGRQWKIIRDIRGVHMRMWQAQKWAQQYSVRQSQGNRSIWLEYLHSTVIELFHGSDLMDEAAARYSATEPPPYCYDVLQRSFHDRCHNVTHTRPYFLTGNKVRSPHVWDLVYDLLGFEVRDGQLEQRDGLRSMSYGVAVRRSIELISDALGHAEACNWFRKLGHLLVLTNWILPWPSNTEFISTTKESQNKNLKRRLIWVSLIYVASAPRQLSRSNVLTYPVEDEEHCITTRGNLQEALNDITAKQFESSGWTPKCDSSDSRFRWTTESLLGCAVYTITTDSFKFGRAVKPGSRGRFIYSLAERGQPPVLRLVDRIRGRTLEELDQLFNDLIVSTQPGLGFQEDAVNAEGSLQTSIPVVNSGTVPRVDAAQNSNLDSNRQLTSNDTFIDPAATTTDTSSDSHAVDSSSDWSPPKRLRRAIRRGL